MDEALGDMVVCDDMLDDQETYQNMYLATGTRPFLCAFSPETIAVAAITEFFKLAPRYIVPKRRYPI